MWCGLKMCWHALNDNWPNSCAKYENWTTCCHVKLLSSELCTKVIYACLLSRLSNRQGTNEGRGNRTKWETPRQVASSKYLFLGLTRWTVRLKEVWFLLSNFKVCLHQACSVMTLPSAITVIWLQTDLKFYAMFESTLFRHLQLALPEKRYKQSFYVDNPCCCVCSIQSAKIQYLVIMC